MEDRAAPAGRTEAARASEADLLAGLRAGDLAAFRRLVERYEPAVARTVTAMLGAGADAEDVGQETFIRFFRSIPQFRGEASIGTYLTRIAMNLSLNHLKKRRRWYRRFIDWSGEADTLPGRPAAGPALPGEDDRAEAVRTALNRLSPRLRSVVVLRLIDGYSTRETAELLGIPAGTVLSRLARAQQELRARLEPYLDEL